MTKTWFMRVAVVAAVVLAAGAAACGNSDNGSKKGSFNDDPTPIPATVAPPFPFSVARSDGKQLTVTAPPKRIVSLSPGATETLYAIGAADAIVAVDKNADFPAAAKDFATRLDAYEPNIEAIVALNPDLVIAANDINGLIGALDRVNIPVLYVDLDKDVKTVDDVLGQIGVLGRITGKNDEAVRIVASLNERIKAITNPLQALASQRAPKIYHELDPTLYSASDKTFVGDLYHMLKAGNIAGDGGGIAYPQLTQEAVIAANPQVIILADEAAGETPATVKARAGWQNIDAVKNDRVFLIDPDIVSRPGPRIVDALEQLAKFLYPQSFR